MRKLSLFCVLVALIANVTAIDLDRCFNLAADQYKIPAKLLKAIAITETKLDQYAINVNTNKSYDIGLMQINSTWLKKLNRVGITQADLLDGCKNIQIGAWILASNIKQYGFNNKAIGAYNSQTAVNQERYARRVLSHLD